MLWHRWLYAWRTRLRGLFDPEGADVDLKDELRYHVARDIDARRASGTSPAEARRQALAALGGMESTAASVRASRFGISLDETTQDVRHGLRLLRLHPGFTLAAIAALALGIGATTAVFSVVNTVLLRPAPFPDPDRIVSLQVVAPQARNPVGSPAKFAHWRRQTQVVQDVSAFLGAVATDTGGAVPEQLQWARVSADYFRLFGAPIVRGRTFAPDEDRPAGQRVALISEQMWERRFDRDPAIVGSTLSLSGETHVIVGVVGATFDSRDLGAPPDVWTPFQLDPDSAEQGHYLAVAGRLRPGVSLAHARTALGQSTDVFRERYPDVIPEGGVFTAEPIRNTLVRDARPVLLVLFGAVGFVLLIACANVASLLLSRATGRQREMAIRTAIGASRARVVRQLLTESVVLAVAGGALGLGLGITGIRALLAISTVGLPRLGPGGALVGLDWRVSAFALAVSVGTGLLFGLIPALQRSRTHLTGTLKEGGGRAGPGLRQSRMRSALVVGQVALALVLLIGSALMIRTSVTLSTTDLGFDGTNVLTMRTSLTGPAFETTSVVGAALRQGVDRVRALPGVEHAAAMCCVLPLDNGRLNLPFVVVGRPLDEEPFHGLGGWTTVSDGYFEVFRISVLRGRVFTDRDAGAMPPVVVINEAMARQFWPDSDPLGDRIVIGRGAVEQFADEPARQIVGVVSNVREALLNTDPPPRMYVPLGQLPDAVNTLMLGLAPTAWIVRTHGPTVGLDSAVQAEIRAASGLPVSNVRTMDEAMSVATAGQRFNLILMTVFGTAALLLAAIGVYGLMAYSVEQRMQEIGLRLALGARTGRVWRMVVLQGTRLVAVGVSIGLALALGLTRLLSSILVGVEILEPVAIGAVATILAGVALGAIAIPARRASRVDPVVALRSE